MLISLHITDTEGAYTKQTALFDTHTQRAASFSSVCYCPVIRNPSRWLTCLSSKDNFARQREKYIIVIIKYIFYILRRERNIHQKNERSRCICRRIYFPRYIYIFYFIFSTGFYSSGGVRGRTEGWDQMGETRRSGIGKLGRERHQKQTDQPTDTTKFSNTHISRERGKSGGAIKLLFL